MVRREIDMYVNLIHIHQMSLCSDFVEGGTEVFVFTSKVPVSGSNFFAHFYQLADVEDEDSVMWEKKVPIVGSQLHTVGNYLGRRYWSVSL